ncbi:DNA-3-methyladenine glycosylase 2 family protein [Salinibacterium sp. G-O1]|uniref:DNA-3-methyladenine glycosylase family protein n=1 Tax=Salinibacterium sp. G-O1 TaxID=3046208 RepID=UPI0024B91932|nr:DNA-3-methyladenine glycosylase 2 family protein [Salinibacterium sp. G-O1]MDJ0333627.1 DNA-3-methyladenine glycosylase 2 family protein [Salinibacterium sp. G-O1]
MTITTLYAPDLPVDLSQTLRPLSRGRFDPTLRVDASGFWRTLRTPHGPATMHLRREQHGIGVAAWGAGAEWAIDGVPELLGRGDDWNGLDVSTSVLLADSLRRNPGLRLLRTRQVFEMLLAAIFEQKVTSKEARHSWRVLITKYGEAAPGPAPDGMMVFPAAETWRRVPSWEWHRAGVGPERSATAIRAAVVAASLERTIDHGRDGAAVAKKLRSISGIGVWTAAETTQRAHGDADSPSVGDYHLPAVVGWALIGKPVDDDGMLELLSPWAGHRQRIMRLIEVSGFVKPRFGPRMTIQDHRGH